MSSALTSPSSPSNSHVKDVGTHPGKASLQRRSPNAKRPFNPHIHLTLLLQQEDEPSQETLVQEMDAMSEQMLDFYLPQICLLAAAPSRSRLQKFILNKAATNMHIALRLHWHAQSMVEDSVPELSERALSLSNACETIVVNARGRHHEMPGAGFSVGWRPSLHEERRRRRSCPPPRSPRGGGLRGRAVPKATMVTAESALKRLHLLSTESLSEKQGVWAHGTLNAFVELGEPVKTSLAVGAEAQEAELQHFMMKQRRCEHFNVQSQLASMIAKLGNTLATFPDKSQRQVCLRDSLRLLNCWLFDRLACIALSNAHPACLFGLHLPILSKGDTRRQIVRFHAEQCRIFSSATRAPFLLVYETVNMDEITLQGEAPASVLAPERLQRFEPRLGARRGSAGSTPRRSSWARRAWEKQNEDSDTSGNELDEGVTARRRLPKWHDLESGLDRHSRLQSEQTQAMRTRIMRMTTAHWNELVDQSLCPMPPPVPSQSSRCRQCQKLPDVQPADARQGVAAGGFREKEVASGRREVPPEVATCRACRRAARALQARYLIWGDHWKDRVARTRSVSMFSHFQSWSLDAVVVKSGDDLRQELLAMQVIRGLREVFAKARLPLWLRPIDVLVLSSKAGLIEYIQDATSLDAMKKRCPNKGLAEIFKVAFGDRLKEAKQNFIASLAAYSLLIYFLQVKDRHNGNLMIDTQGHVIHIDFGFMLSNSPGGNVNFEQSPFKLTQDFLDVMGGSDSVDYDYFRSLVIKGFLEARKHVDELVLPIRLMLRGSKLPCFREGPELVLQGLHNRLFLDITDEACVEKVVELIDASVNNWRTIQYDNFQRIVNGIL